MSQSTDLSAPIAASISSASAPDIHRYAHHVEHLDLSETRKTELLAAVWQIMRSFVDRAFGDDAAQLCRIPVDSGDTAQGQDGIAVIDLRITQDCHGAGAISRAFNEQSERGSKERINTNE